ncbi:MAG: glycosyltransferase family 2 protein [Bacillota bacterium]|nr:glycosyltransferase family 2 protein [Bacillota bacterium]
MKTAVLIPCYNEELTIAKVIQDFKRELPDAEIYVYDNNSKDKTAEIAQANGAIVRREYRQGKGNVVRSMFMDIEADCYVMVDGDDTYPVEFVHDLIRPIMNKEANMVIGDRLSNGTYKSENNRAFHNLGNQMVRVLINKLFHNNIKDMMTGYRSFDKEFVKSMPVLSSGFEIETEMTIHALDKRFILREVPIVYRDRPEGSFSKLSTFNDGVKVLKTIFMLFKDYKPLIFFSMWSFVLALLGLLVGLPVIMEFIRYRYIYKVPSAILAVGLGVLSMLFLCCGLILDTVVKQNKRIYELNIHEIRRRLNSENNENQIKASKSFIA